MNITKESLEQEIAQMQKVIWMYNTNPEYINPNCSLQQAKDLLEKLNKEYYTNIRID